jgi:hypothetical protein
MFVSLEQIEEWCKKQKELGFAKINLDHLEVMLVSLEQIEEWCKKQKELGFAKINLDHLEVMLKDDLVKK